ncbi:MAG: hypothetical protein KF764_26765 [Labilithrix sp.]|nr:hypothetical protein [Labilithrix sp.]
MKRSLTTTSFILIVGAVAIACGGTSSPQPSGGVTSNASPASAGEASSSDPASGTPPAPTSGAAPAKPVTRALPAGGAKTCADTTCSDDTFCDLQTVTCVRAPCPAVPRCISGMHPCAVTTCITGNACESHDGEAVCIPIASACGRTTCETGMVCCNASCGICTPPDGACTQQACE